MARTARATTKSKQRRKEAADDRRASMADDANRVSKDDSEDSIGGGNRDHKNTGTKKSGLVVKRPGMTDLNLDDLANCPSPEDALLLLSAEAAEAMQAVSDDVRLEVCKTIVALGDVVARTHEPLIAAIKLRLGGDGAIVTSAEANGRTFYKRSDGGVTAAFSGAVCAVARAEAKQRKGKAHAEALTSWGLALVEAGQYLAEIAETARGIADEIAEENAKCGKENSPADKDPFVCGRPEGHKGGCFPYVTPDDALAAGFRIHSPPYRVPRTVQHCQPQGNMDDTPLRWEKCKLIESCPHGDGHEGPCDRVRPARVPGRGGVKMCTIGDQCMLENGHPGHCKSRKCGKYSIPSSPDGCIRPHGHDGNCSGVVG